MILLEVWVIQDEAHYRRMLARILTRSSNVRACRVFPSCPEMLAAIETAERPEVILMDLGLPRMSGLEGIKELSRIAPDIAVIALSPAVARIVLDNLRAPSAKFDLKLAARELQVLEELALGRTVKEIAASLAISESTVSTYLGRIYAKLEVQSQSGAVAKALRNGLIK